MSQKSRLHEVTPPGLHDAVRFALQLREHVPPSLQAAVPEATEELLAATRTRLRPGMSAGTRLRCDRRLARAAGMIGGRIERGTTYFPHMLRLRAGTVLLGVPAPCGTAAFHEAMTGTGDAQ